MRTVTLHAVSLFKLPECGCEQFCKRICQLFGALMHIFPLLHPLSHPKASLLVMKWKFNRKKFTQLCLRLVESWKKHLTRRKERESWLKRRTLMTKTWKSWPTPPHHLHLLCVFHWWKSLLSPQNLCNLIHRRSLAEKFGLQLYSFCACM